VSVILPHTRRVLTTFAAINLQELLRGAAISIRIMAFVLGRPLAIAATGIPLLPGDILGKIACLQLERMNERPSDWDMYVDDKRTTTFRVDICISRKSFLNAMPRFVHYHC